MFPGGEPRRLTSGFHFTEGPVWDIREDCLYFTDFQNYTIAKWNERDGGSLYRADSNRAIGLSMAADGRIVSAESAAHGIAYADKKESVLIAGTFEGKRFNSPNDVVVSRKGEIFFTDPYSVTMGGPKELDFSGIFRISTEGKISLIDDSFTRPNGIALSPDESILYVNDTASQQIIAFSLGKDGSASRIGVFASVDPAYGPGVVDGMKVDTEGNVYVTGPGGIWVMASDGSPIAILYTPENTGNFCFGGKDSSTLYITATTSVYALPVGIPGIVPYRR
jgi:gluconolactonase